MIYHVYANQSNIGDWLSAKGIQSAIHPLPVMELFCDAPFVQETLATLRNAEPNDFIIIGGGGLFMDYFMPFWSGFEEVSAKIPFVIWGVGACDLKCEQTLPPLQVIKNIVGRARLCVFRDELTRNLFTSELRMPVICPTVLAVPPQPTASRQVLHVDSFDNVGEKVFDQMMEESRHFAEKTQRRFRRTNNVISAGHAGELRKTLDLYATSDLIVSSRLHGCIIALALDRPVLAVSGDHKIESFMDTAGLTEWVIDLGEMEQFSPFLETLGTQPDQRAFVEKGREANRAIAREVKGLIL